MRILGPRGQPLPEALLLVARGNDDDDEGESTSSDAFGRCALPITPDLDAPTLRVRAVFQGVGRSREIHATLPAEGHLELGDLTLEFVEGLRLRVLDADERPAPFVPLSFEYAGEDYTAFADELEPVCSLQRTTDAEGRLVAGHLRAGRYRIEVGYGDTDTEDLPALELETRSEEQTIRLGRSRLLVHLLDERGRALPEPFVHALIFADDTADAVEQAMATGMAPAELLQRRVMELQLTGDAHPSSVQLFAHAGSYVLLRRRCAACGP